MDYNLLDEIIPAVESETLPVDEKTILKEELELAELTQEAEDFAELHTKLLKTADIIDSALEAELAPEAIELLGESLSLGLGMAISLEADDGAKTSENIKASFKKFVAQFVAFVRKVWTKFMASFGASQQQLEKLKTDVGATEKAVKLSELPYIAAMQIAGGGELEMALKTSKVGEKLATLYKERSVKEAVGVYITKPFSKYPTGLPDRKYISGTVAGRKTKSEKVYTIPKSASAFTVITIDNNSEAGDAMIGISTVNLDVKAIEDAAESKKLEKAKLLEMLNYVKPKEKLKTMVDEYYGYTKDIVNEDFKSNSVKRFYSASVKYAFTVVNAQMAHNKNMASDAKKFIKLAK